MRVTVLGCGGSSGVPLIGNRWYACDPNNPRNRRRRASVMIERDGKILLIDTSPDLREQLLDADVSHIDAVLYTHGHADHTHGLDELREICRLMGRAMPVWGDAQTLEQLERRFDYAFRPLEEWAKGFYYRPVLESHIIDGPFVASEVPVVPFVQNHGWTTSLGFRIDNLAYSTDVLALDEAAFAALEGVEVWLVDCVREEPHPVHAHLELVLSWIARLRPRQTVLIHMGPTLDYEALRQHLPPGVEPAYDGMVIDV